jgi:predicted transcriptional regulator
MINSSRGAFTMTTASTGAREARAVTSGTRSSSPASYRRAIMDILASADEKGLTLREIEKRVGKHFGGTMTDSVEDQVQSLLDWELVVTSERRLTLTHEGRSYVRGVKALLNTA